MENDVLYNRVMNVVHEDYGPPGGEGTKEITITENGTTTENVRRYTNAEITVAVPNSYTESDEGKVVDNGSLVSQSSATYTANDTYDTTLINEVTVNVSGGGTDYLAQRLNNTLISYESDDVTTQSDYGFYNLTNLQSISLTNLVQLGMQYFRGCTNLTSVNLPKANGNWYLSQQFYGCSSLTGIVLPMWTSGITSEMFRNCTALEYVDIKGIQTSSSGGYSEKVSSNGFNGCTNLTKLILRNTSAVGALQNINAFTNTPFASGGSGGTLYVPSALISSYQSATNWSTILGYANNSIQAIEGSIYETQYADGTPIPTP